MSNLGGLASERGMHDGITLAGAVAASAIAAGVGDNTETDGEEFDRLPPGPDDAQRYDSAAVAVFAQATLGDGETATLTATIQHADLSGGAFADIPVADQPAPLVLTGGGGGTTEKDTLKHGVRLSRLKRFVRVQVLIALSAGAAAIGSYGGGFVAGGAAVVPTP